MTHEVNPAARAALVAGLSERLKDIPWHSAYVTATVTAYLNETAQQAASGAVTGLLFQKGSPTLLFNAMQLTALQRLGADGFKQVVREAWKLANGEDPPAHVPGYSHFGNEVLMQFMQKLLPKKKPKK